MVKKRTNKIKKREVKYLAGSAKYWSAWVGGFIIVLTIVLISLDIAENERNKVYLAPEKESISVDNFFVRVTDRNGDNIGNAIVSIRINGVGLDESFAQIGKTDENGLFYTRLLWEYPFEIKISKEGCMDYYEEEEFSQGERLELLIKLTCDSDMR